VDGTGHCSRHINGLFFGCLYYDNHLWLRPLGFIGLGRKPKPGRRRVAGGTEVTTPALVSPTEAVSDTSPHRALFYATMIATACAVASGITDVLTFFGQNPGS
jgi:hypothetical protein